MNSVMRGELRVLSCERGQGGKYLAEVGYELAEVVDRSDERAQLCDVRRDLHAFYALLTVGGEVVLCAADDVPGEVDFGVAEFALLGLESAALESEAREDRA
jgi:hypothetical protein